MSHYGDGFAAKEYPMRSIRPLTHDDFNAWYPLIDGAYPSFSMPLDAKQEYFDRVISSTDMDWVGCFEDSDLQGCYRPHYFKTNLFGRIVPTAGLGGVAVDLRYKRKGVCRDMVIRFHADMIQRGYGFASLYPFRLSFYRAVGYGWGTSMYRYQIRPAYIRARAGDANLENITTETIGQMFDYINRNGETSHGMIMRSSDPISQASILKQQNALVVRRRGQITGAMTYSFINVDPRNDFSYDMEVYSMYWDAPADLQELMAFIRGQQDQVRYAFVNSGRDDFIYLLNNIGVEGGDNVLWEYIGTGAVAWGMMYRILDLDILVQQTSHRNYNGATLTLGLDMRDETLPQQNRRRVLCFDKGELRIDDAAVADVDLSIDVADFSSLWMGCVSLRRLVEYGTAGISKTEKLDSLDALFAVSQKPFNTVIF